MQIDLANNSLADKFLLIASNNCNNIVEEASDSVTGNSKAPTEEKILLTIRDINQLLNCIVFKNIKLVI